MLYSYGAETQGAREEGKNSHPSEITFVRASWKGSDDEIFLSWLETRSWTSWLPCADVAVSPSFVLPLPHEVLFPISDNLCG